MDPISKEKEIKAMNYLVLFDRKLNDLSYDLGKLVGIIKDLNDLIKN